MMLSPLVRGMALIACLGLVLVDVLEITGTVLDADDGHPVPGARVL